MGRLHPTLVPWREARGTRCLFAREHTSCWRTMGLLSELQARLDGAVSGEPGPDWLRSRRYQALGIETVC
jgi:hypothetical protein